MAKLTPQQAAEKQARRLKGATEDMRRGIESVTEAPGKKAAQKVDKLRNNWLASIESGKWASRVQSVTLDEWKSAMLEKGVARVAAGIDAARPKVEQFYTELFAYQDRLQQEVKAMPDVTLEDSINRMTHFIRGMSKFQRKG